MKPNKSEIRSQPKKRQKKQLNKPHRKKNHPGVIFLLIFLLLLIIGTVLLINLNIIIKTAIEKYGSEATQTAVRVNKVKISLIKGTSSINGLTIANPQGFETSHAFSLGEISIGIDIRSLNKEIKVINDIVIRAPEVFFELNAENKNNLNELQKNVSGNMPKQPKTAKKQKISEEPELMRSRCQPPRPAEN